MSSARTSFGARCSASDTVSLALSKANGVFNETAAQWPFRLPWTLGTVLALVGYVWVFAITTEMSPLRTLVTSAINVGTAYALGFLVRAALKRLCPGRAPLAQLIIHLALAPAYSLVWYLATISLLGWQDGSLLGGASIVPFQGPAFVWQTFQGFALYASAAALALLAERPPPVAPSAPRNEVAAPSSTARQLLVRDGDQIRIIKVEEIVMVAAADDYVEIVTSASRHLARKSLAELETELPSSFIRVHRSTLVNLDRLLSAEPAGAGRMTLHLSGGKSVIASRSGARLLRERSA